MGNTKAYEVIDSFESSFADKRPLPFELEIQWVKKAAAKFSIEIDPIKFDPEILEFDQVLDQYVIDTLAAYMKQYYQERMVSLTNKRISIVGRDLSYDGSNGAKTAEKAHLDYAESQAIEMTDNQKPTAYV